MVTVLTVLRLYCISIQQLIGHLHGSKSYSVIPPRAPLHSVIRPHCSVIAPHHAKSNKVVYSHYNITENKARYDNSTFP